MQEKKRILYITLRSGFGGATKHVDQLVNNFQKEYDIYCAAPIEKPYGVNWLEKLGKEKFFVLPYRSFSVKYFIRLIFFIEKNKISIVHAHGKGAGIYARLAKIFTPRIFLIFTFHGLHIANYTKPVRYIYIILERALGKLTNQFINVSNGEKQLCIDNKLFKASKSIVIFNAIENDENQYPAKNELRIKINLPVDKFLIISVLRFDTAKNITALLRIAKNLSDDTDFQFILIGEGEEKLSIENKISENEIKNVKLLGFQQNVDEYLHSSDLFLSTSFGEGLPYSLIEAVRAGVPIVASNVTGNNEVVFDNQNGYLFRVNDTDSATKFIRELKISNELLKIFAQNSKMIFRKHFLLQEMINKLGLVYSKTL